MKHKIFLSLTALLLLLEACSQSNKTVWETPPLLKVPESAFYDAHSKRIYVSNINGKPAAKDHNGFVSVLDTKGNIVNLEWVTGLNAPKGIAKHNNKLFVTDIDRVAEVDILKGKISKFYHVDGASFLNDIVCDKRGNIFISDSDKGVVFKLDTNGRPSIWCKDKILIGANGLAIKNNKLLVGTYNGIAEIDIRTKKRSLVIKHKGMIDGLIPAGKDKYIVSDWEGKVEILQKGKKPEILLNNINAKINAADLGFIPDRKIILIPTFFDNRVIAIKM